MSLKLIEQVVELTNVERAKAGLQPLKLNDRLVDAAQDHSNDMAEDDFFSHTGADGSTIGDRVKASGYQYSTTGENIAAGQTTAEDVVEGWMNSPGHRANILNPDYTEIGVGYEYLQNDTGSINYNHYWTQVFGTPLNSNAGSQSESPTPEVQLPVDNIEEVEVVDEVSNAPEIEETSELFVEDTANDMESDLEEIGNNSDLNNPVEIEETSELPVENTADDMESDLEDSSNNVFSSSSSTSFSSSSSTSFSSSSSDILTGQTDGLALSGDSITSSADDSSKMTAYSYIEQFKNNLSELLNDFQLGSSVDIQANSDDIVLVEGISASDLATMQKYLAFEMSDSLM